MKIQEGNENYTCTVVALPPLQDVKSLDNLKKVTIFGNDCLVGKDSKVGDLHLFFPAESQINSGFLCDNNLYRDKTRNSDESKTGFFEENGRVKAIKFKGVTSTGFVIPIESLEEYVDTKKLKEGDDFNEIDGILLCWKYVVKRQQATAGTKEPKQSKHQRKLERFDKLVPNQFRFHQSTPQLGKNFHVLSPSDFICITDKWHGTSAVYSNVLIRRQLRWYEKLAMLLGIKVVDKEYDQLYSSRRVLQNRYINKNVNLGYYGEDIYGVVKKEIEQKLEQGITLYGEIVGYAKSGKAIQGQYDYGCSPGMAGGDLEAVSTDFGTHKFVVYRITYTKPDGNVIELDWFQIQNYCNKHQLETVPILYHGFAGNLFPRLDQETDWQQSFFDKLQEYYLEKDCVHCKNKVAAEGIVLRLDGCENFLAYKLKSKRFLKHETEEKDKGVIDMEDDQGGEAETVEAGVN